MKESPSFILSEASLTRLEPAGVLALLRAGAAAEMATALLPAAAQWPQVDLPVVRALLDCWPEISSDLLATVSASADAGSAMGRWLLAELRQQAGETVAAEEQWAAVIDAGGLGELSEALLAQARLVARRGDPVSALGLLRAALRGETKSQAFLTKADRFYARLAASGGLPGRALKLAVLGSSTTTFLLPALRMAAVRDGFLPEVYEGAYGAFRQEILNPASELYTFKPDFVVLATHWRDAHLEAFSVEPETAARRVAEDFSGLWAALLQRHPCTILQHNFDLPWDDPAGHLGLVEPSSRAACLRAVNRLLVEAAPRGVVIADFDGLAAQCGKRAWAEARQWHMHKQHPAPVFLPELANLHLSLIRAALGQSKKVLVLDLDNTLWHGVIGEDGLDGIRVGAPSAEGEAHAALQRYALELKARGVLLAVCSKNNEADAKLPFAQHDGMVLRLDDFVAFSANWEDKSENLRRMAKALNLGIDSFVFLDDNPVERALVRRNLPEVAVPEIGGDPARYVEILQQGRWFETLGLSAEDRDRHVSYQANAAREALHANVTDLGEFLKQLEMRVTRGPFNDVVFDRVTQLLGKTNQFNLTTRRHSREQVRQFAEDLRVWTQWFRLEDRFGDNGLIGLMVAVPAEENTWEVDTFLMSCRVIGRQMEEYMMAVLLTEAKRRGIRRVTGRYLPTLKNGMVAELYLRLGFSPQEAAGEERAFIFDLEKQDIVVPQFFQTLNPT